MGMTVGYALTEKNEIKAGFMTYCNRNPVNTRYNKKASLEAFVEVNVGLHWISIRRAAQMLGIAPETLRNWIKQGVLKVERRDRRGFPPEMSRELALMGGGSYKRLPRIYQVVSMYDLEAIIWGREE
jgi:hypothetical protein